MPRGFKNICPKCGSKDCEFVCIIDRIMGT